MIEQLSRWCWSVAAGMRLPLPAESYHEAALRAAYERDYRLAELLLERAARDYSAAYRLERLAHARVQQLFVHNAAAGYLVTLVDCPGHSDRLQRLRGVATGQSLRSVEPGEAQLRPAEERRLPEAA